MRSGFGITRWIWVPILTLAGFAQAGPPDCPRGQQRRNGVCVDHRIVNFVECLQGTSGGPIQTVSYEESVADRGNTVGVQAGLKLVKVGGKVQVIVDDRDVARVVKAAEATFGEELVQTCRCLADGSCPKGPGAAFTKAAARQRKGPASVPAPRADPAPQTSAPASTGICKEAEIKALAHHAGLDHPPPPNTDLKIQPGDFSYWVEQRLPCARIDTEFQARKAALEDAALTGTTYPTQGDLSSHAQRFLPKSR